MHVSNLIAVQPIATSFLIGCPPLCLHSDSNYNVGNALLNLLLKLVILSAQGSGQNDNWMIKLIPISVLFASGLACPISISFSIHPISLHL